MLVNSIQSETFIALNDGRLFKVKGSGGTGTNLLNITSNPQYTKYILGTQEFDGVVSCIAQVSGSTLLGFCDGRLLKVKGTGGTGSNMFAVTDHGPGQEFGSASGYHEYEGGQVFPSGVIGIYPIPEGMFVVLIGGMFLKVQGGGGTGHNLLNINSNPQYPKYILGIQEQFTPYTPSPKVLVMMTLCDVNTKLNNKGFNESLDKCSDKAPYKFAIGALTGAATGAKVPGPYGAILGAVVVGASNAMTDDDCLAVVQDLFSSAKECLNEGQADINYVCGPGCEAIQKDLNDQIGTPIHFDIPNPGPTIGPVYPGETDTPGEGGEETHTPGEGGEETYTPGEGGAEENGDE